MFFRTFFIFMLVASALLRADVIYLEQGWDADQREEFCFVPQGSHLVPYKWFLNLEQADSDTLFRDNGNMSRYGFLPVPASKRNPDGLPIGFVREGVNPAERKLKKLNPTQRRIIRESTNYEIKQARFGTEFDESLYPKERKAWLGLTCAACHTHELEYGGNTIRIDGGASQADIETMLSDLGKALHATHTDASKLKRFAERLGRGDADDRFQKEVEQISVDVNRMVQRNKAKHPYGYARLDAFGAILNAVCETALEIRENRVEANAPVSYPSLWNVPDMAYVQWGATIDFAEARNVGEVLGVFGDFSVKPGPNQFKSTVRLKNLVDIEHEMLTNLTSPNWPEAYFGALDYEKVALGQRLFEQNCQSCHPVRNAMGEFERNEIGRIPITSNTVDEIGTDSQFIDNLRTAAKTGDLKPLMMDKAVASRPDILRTAVGGIMLRRAKIEGVDLGDLKPKEQAPPHPDGTGSGYISRPLEGIWATAPYFHNGSVPNLYETLLPSCERSKQFWVGSRKFDPVKVGFDQTPSKQGSLFRVLDDDGKPIVGNSNAGHEGHGKTETKENGKWRKFTDDERWALVEYMKSLSSSTPFEQIPEGEAAQIDNIVRLMTDLMRRRYPEGRRMLRGVHPKGHGCVKATFEVRKDLPPELQVGVFQRGRVYDSYIRFSNAAGVVGPDSKKDKDGKTVHGSRGMAVKIMDVEGVPLTPRHGRLTQDFVMVNQPAFAFANVEDYELVNQVLLRDKEDPRGFFAKRLGPGSTPGEKARGAKTAQIAARIRASGVDSDPPAFSPPPQSPVDNAYFSAAPFRFGSERVMKFRVTPVARSTDEPNVADPDYLENALIARLNSGSVEFDFEVQVRTRDQVDLATDIENASTEWKDEYVKVARIVIPSQEVDSPELRLECERLFFTPWHGITAHQPLGGINRLRRAVYDASAFLRNLPKEGSGK